MNRLTQRIQSRSPGVGTPSPLVKRIRVVKPRDPGVFRPLSLSISREGAKVADVVLRQPKCGYFAFHLDPALHAGHALAALTWSPIHAGLRTCLVAAPDVGRTARARETRPPVTSTPPLETRP